MKLGTTELLKFKKLCRRLNLTQWQCVGLLESIWQLTAKNAPQGNIGKFTNEDIALTIGWDDDEEKLIEELVSCGWLDTDQKERLLVHDWHEHAPNHIKGGLAKAGKKLFGTPEAKLQAKDEAKLQAKDEAKLQAKLQATNSNLTNSIQSSSSSSSSSDSSGASCPDEDEEENFKIIDEMYPTKKTKRNFSKRIQAIKAAIQRDGFEKVKNGTRIFSDYFGCWKAGSAHFASDPIEFYNNSEYLTPSLKNQNLDAEKWEKQRKLFEAEVSRKREIANKKERERQKKQKKEIREKAEPYLDIVVEFSKKLEKKQTRLEMEKLWYKVSDELKKMALDKLVWNYLEGLISQKYWSAVKKLEV